MSVDSVDSERIVVLAATGMKREIKQGERAVRDCQYEGRRGGSVCHRGQ